MAQALPILGFHTAWVAGGSGKEMVEHDCNDPPATPTPAGLPGRGPRSVWWDLMGHTHGISTVKCTRTNGRPPGVIESGGYAIIPNDSLI
jgi:hypothetical protein